MADETKQLECALDLFRRLPPVQLETNLSFVSELIPNLADELLQTVDCPLKVRKCEETGKDFLICDYNRDGDSYRSPFSNKYYPTLEDGVLPRDDLRELEKKANDIFQMYCEQYYEGGISSVYFWEVEEGFAASVLFKKDGSGLRGVEKGIWDSIHVIEVQEHEDNKTATYRLTTTIILSMSTQDGQLDLSGSVQRQEDMDATFDNAYNTHIVNMGNMIQKMENSLRTQLQNVYFDKAREITRTLRNPQSSGERKLQMNLQNELANALINRKR
ncbi:hypothetical protein ABK040_001045 [Willaertia magna]